MQVTGILQSIPEEIYEAARVDGAGPVKIFFKITLPYMLFVTAPYLITTFAGNINNFNVIYLLSAGKPTPVGDFCQMERLPRLERLPERQIFLSHGSIS